MSLPPPDGLPRFLLGQPPLPFEPVFMPDASFKIIKAFLWRFGKKQAILIMPKNTGPPAPELPVPHRPEFSRRARAVMMGANCTDHRGAFFCYSVWRMDHGCGLPRAACMYCSLPALAARQCCTCAIRTAFARCKGGLADCKTLYSRSTGPPRTKKSDTNHLI